MICYLLGTVLLTAPAIYLRAAGVHVSPPVDAAIFGVGILGAAFLLAWAAEVAQLDISKGLALAVLALIAVLPEYAVDLYFAWTAAAKPEYVHYATANMTGANRLLVGAGWPFIVGLYCWRFRKRELVLEEGSRNEISFLTLATIYAFLIPLKGTLGLIDCVFFIAIFVVYAWRTAHLEVEEPDLIGPARLIAGLPTGARRLVNLALFAYSGYVIFLSAEPFAESLIATGRTLGVNEYVLIRWLAPLASEAPEFIIAAIWSFRGEAVSAIGALISSKVNQWTLLVGTIPLVYSFGLGRVGTMQLDRLQQDEILLTAAQSIFAIMVLINLRIHLWEAGMLFVLFAVQLVFPDIHREASYAYCALALVAAYQRRSDIAAAFAYGVLGKRSSGGAGSAER